MSLLAFPCVSLPVSATCISVFKGACSVGRSGECGMAYVGELGAGWNSQTDQSAHSDCTSTVGMGLKWVGPRQK